ncbi:unnamed protein product, partial [Polarella glacialis]
MAEDQTDLTSAGEGSARKPLSSFLRSVLESQHWPLSWDARHRFGFLHRLDVPSSGLVVAAKTYQAFFDLQLQLSTGLMVRDYVVLCHGWLPRQRRQIDAPLGWDAKDRTALSAVCFVRGKPSRTAIRALTRALGASSGEAFTLVSVQIATGRRHQIRSHLAHIGHPTVCDARYSSQATADADVSWTPRNFLHRRRLVFKDSAGIQQEVTEPLPDDLVTAFARLRPLGT